MRAVRFVRHACVSLRGEARGFVADVKDWHTGLPDPGEKPLTLSLVVHAMRDTAMQWAQGWRLVLSRKAQKEAREEKQKIWDDATKELETVPIQQVPQVFAKVLARRMRFVATSLAAGVQGFNEGFEEGNKEWRSAMDTMESDWSGNDAVAREEPAGQQRGGVTVDQTIVQKAKDDKREMKNV